VEVEAEDEEADTLTEFELWMPLPVVEFEATMLVYEPVLSV
jgi:hypothetical protein